MLVAELSTAMSVGGRLNKLCFFVEYNWGETLKFTLSYIYIFILISIDALVMVH